VDGAAASFRKDDRVTADPLQGMTTEKPQRERATIRFGFFFALRMKRGGAMNFRGAANFGFGVGRYDDINN
jgi:hypothetical protein